MPRSTTFTYDARGGLQQIASTDAATLVLQRDLLGRPTTQTVADGVVGTNWTPLGDLRQVTTRGSNVHDLTYTGRRQLSTYVPPVLANGTRPGQLSLTYTAMGKPASVTLANGATMTLTRDPPSSGSPGRVTTAVVGGVTYSYGYHPQTGQRTSMTGSDGTSLLTGYNGHLVISRAWAGTSSPVTGQIGFGYNADFNISAMSVNGQQAAVFAFDRDRLLTMAGGLSIVRNPQSGDPIGTTLGQVTTSATYDEHGSIATFRALRSGTAFYEYAVAQRDGQGRIVEIAETSSGQTHTKAYQYDALGRLHAVLTDGASTAVYTYTGNGNRESRETSSDTETGVYDAQDRIVSYGTCSYTMDAAGFLSARDCGAGAETFTYDAAGALRSAATANGDTISYVIDPNGRRIGRRVNGALEKGWLYLDGLRPVAQLNGAGQLEAVYIYGTRANIPDYIVEKVSGGDVLYRVIADHLGTPRRVVRASDGVIVHELDVDEWGRVLRETGIKLGLHPFGFAGGLRDQDTGMVRFGARDYDPYTGRWTSRDPVLFSGGQANLYAYVDNDPVNHTDPTGLGILGDFWTGLSAKLTLDAIGSATEHIAFCKNLRQKLADALCKNQISEEQSEKFNNDLGCGNPGEDYAKLEAAIDGTESSGVDLVLKFFGL
jgi:RHS repeat-associated protein